MTRSEEVEEIVRGGCGRQGRRSGGGDTVEVINRFFNAIMTSAIHYTSVYSASGPMKS